MKKKKQRRISKRKFVLYNLIGSLFGYGFRQARMMSFKSGRWQTQYLDNGHWARNKY